MAEQPIAARDDLAALLPAFVPMYWGQSLGATVRSTAGSQQALAEARCALALAADRRGACAVRAYNPTDEHDGYHVPGAVLETNSPDLPFLVDSVGAELHARGIGVERVIHPVIGVERAADGAITGLTVAGSAPAESIMHFALDRRLEQTELADLADAVRTILANVAVVVADFEPLRDRAVERLIELVRAGAAHEGMIEDDPDEVVAFLEWLRDENFIFLGFREETQPPGEARRPLAETALGLLRDRESGGLGFEAELEIGSGARDPRLVRALRSQALSPVHRREPMETLIVGRVTTDGSLDGIARLVGLFTQRAVAEPASRTPQLRRKLALILEAEHLVAGSHDAKAAIAIFDRFPKTELLAAPVDDLRGIIAGLVAAPENDVRLVGRLARHRRQASLMMVMPRERLTPGLTGRLRAIVADAYQSTHVEARESLTETGRALLHIVVRSPADLPAVDLTELEQRLRDESRTWADLTEELLAGVLGGERAGQLGRRWLRHMPEAYQAETEPALAAGDVQELERQIAAGKELHIALAGGVHVADGRAVTRVALYKRGQKVELTDATPLLEAHGLRVIEELPTRIVAEGEESWIQAFAVVTPEGEPIDLDRCGVALADSIEACWSGRTESDSLNRLIVGAGLDWRQVKILRAYRRYRQRLGSRYSESFQNDVVAANPQITAALVALFECRFALEEGVRADGQSEDELRARVIELLDDVELLDHDRILRNQLGLIDATLRTNVYRDGRDALAFKFRSADVPAMPQPAPLYEIYVYAADMEGIHLRGGEVARGGLRWSDRMDYRTEVYGLMRAQMTKNAVIVPDGAKGGFYLKRPPADPAALRAEVKAVYIRYIEALLDVTDNLDEAGTVIHPQGVRVHDGADTYFVVAADKGTATFSDTANEIAVRRGFWLGDAFASGGSNGYDHKKLGITAKGAWESVKRHFRELATDPERDPVTAVGVGDMSGDVFGNGMLLSRSLRLIAAYDHRHIFIDPDPQDAERCWQERRRLFELPGSSWDDYDRDLISAGGGVFPRSAKQVTLTAEIRGALGIDDAVASCTPSELIQAVLRAPVDLLWNGGIGTVVKATHESDADAQDRASDAIRVDAARLRCRVVGEGGNLGFTHRARIEAARAGILINADFIDNSAGVDSSDHEVNLKILLDLAVRRGLLSVDDRNALLHEVTGDVVEHVLYDSFLQAQILSEEVAVAHERMFAYEDLMEELERRGMLSRESEALPGSDEIADRRRLGQGLERPELAVLLAYAKRLLTDQLLASELPENPYFDTYVRAYFPPAVVDAYGELIADHPLRRELVATLVANDLVNSLGPTFAAELSHELGASPQAIVGSYRIAREVTGAEARWVEIEALGAGVGADVARKLMDGVDVLVATVARWYLLHEPEAEIEPAIAAARDAFATLEREMWSLRSHRWRADAEARAAAVLADGVPEQLALRHASQPALYHGADIVRAAAVTGREIVAVAEAFFALGERLGLERIETLVLALPASGRVQRWAQQGLLDDLLAGRRELVIAALSASPELEPSAAVDAFLERCAPAIERLRTVAVELGADGTTDAATLALAVRRLRELGV